MNARALALEAYRIRVPSRGTEGVLRALLEGQRAGKPMKLEFAYKPVSS